MRLGDRPHVDIEAISTTSISLDRAIGIGGVPRGRIVEIYGPESSGKTTLALHIIAEAQRNGGEAAIIDAEHALDVNYATALGVDTEQLLISQPDSGEQALEIAEAMIRTGQLSVVVIDSVAALVPTAEINGSMGDAMMGSQARLMSQAMRKLIAVIAQSNTCVIFINQIRQKIGVMFGSPETTTGGIALKFYASVRLDIRRIGAIKDGEEFKGNRTRVKVVKNKVGSPFKECEFDIIYGQGISREGDILDLAVEKNIVDKSGAWYAYKGTKIGQGREKAKDYLKENPDTLNEIAGALDES
jgi:recombination protein RecA